MRPFRTAGWVALAALGAACGGAGAYLGSGSDASTSGAGSDATAGPDASSGSSGTPGADAGKPCTISTDCADPKVANVAFQCGFPIADGCSATGTCFVEPKVECDAYEPGCACDGTLVNLTCNGLPGGDAPAPLLHSGVCMGPGPVVLPDAGSSVCGANFACPRAGTFYNCQPIVPPDLVNTCSGPCQTYVTAHCSGVTFAN
jgi:hypothetical protein